MCQLETYVLCQVGLPGHQQQYCCWAKQVLQATAGCLQLPVGCALVAAGRRLRPQTQHSSQHLQARMMQGIRQAHGTNSTKHQAAVPSVSTSDVMGHEPEVDKDPSAEFN